MSSAHAAVLERTARRRAARLGSLLRAPWVLAVVLCALGVTSAAQAQEPSIGPGQERNVLALFAPHTLGAEVARGFALWGVSIERTRVVVTLRASGGRDVTVTLLHPDFGQGAVARTRSFAVLRSGAAGLDADAAFRALLIALTRNDRGHFWGAAAEAVSHREGVPLDGILAIVLIFALGLLLAGRLLIGAPRWLGPALAATVLSGALVRLALSPQAFLGAWPWSRLYVHERAVAFGPWLAAYTQHAGHAIFLSDVMLWTSFAYAVAMPLVLFSHATYLLRDPRAGLAASFALAFLPQHIRYSICEDGFVASLVLTSLAFALLHGALRDPSRLVRWLLLLALPWVLYPGYLLRPLNILFIVVYTAAILVLHRDTAPRWRRALVLGVVLVVGAAASVEFFHRHEDTVEAISAGRWLANVLRVLTSPRLLLLDDPTRTPLPLIVLAPLGAVLAWRAGERVLVAFLGGWLLLFVVAHAVVVQESMQPRYHLHLVVPFLLLAAGAVTRLAPKHRRWLWLAAALTVVSPWLLRDFVQDADYTEVREYAFVRATRGSVPFGCTVLEYAGTAPTGGDLRFARIGTLATPDGRSKFRVVGVFAGGHTGHGDPSLDDLLRDPPRCLALYEGLACSTSLPSGQTYAPECLALRERLHAVPLRRESVRARLYDSRSAGARPLAVSRVPLRFSLSRLTSRR